MCILLLQDLELSIWCRKQAYTWIVRTVCALQWETCTVLWKLLDKCHFLKAGFLHPSPGRKEGKQVQRPGSKSQLDVVREWERLCLADPEGRAGGGKR